MECAHVLTQYTHGLTECAHGLTECPHCLTECAHSLPECAHSLTECAYGLTECAHGLTECAHSLMDCAHGLAECAHGFNKGPRPHQESPRPQERLLPSNVVPTASQSIFCPQMEPPQPQGASFSLLEPPPPQLTERPLPSHGAPTPHRESFILTWSAHGLTEPTLPLEVALQIHRLFFTLTCTGSPHDLTNCPLLPSPFSFSALPNLSEKYFAGSSGRVGLNGVQSD